MHFSHRLPLWERRKGVLDLWGSTVVYDNDEDECCQRVLVLAREEAYVSKYWCDCSST